MNSEERELLIEETIERMLKILPEVIGNLMAANAMYSKLTKDFYDNNDGFKEHREIVAEVISKIEGADPTIKHEDVLKAAVPIIRQHIGIKDKLSMDTVSRSNVGLAFDEISNHGTL